MTRSNKKSTFWKWVRNLACGGLLASGAQAAHAQNNGSDATIEQIGSGNLAVIESDEQSKASVTQNGTGNMATVDIRGARNGSDGGIVYQRGDDSEIDVFVDGDDNQFRVKQFSEGATNRATLSQTGSFNDIDVIQRAAGLTTGLANSAEITQIGFGNYAGVDQSATDATLIGYSNQAEINQNGINNRATSTQAGSNNKSEQTQVGNDNVSNILQTGDDNLAIHRQFGNGLSVPESLGGIVIEQTGGASITVEQYSAGNAPNLP